MAAVQPRRGPELKCGSQAKGWRPQMRPLPILFPAVSPKIAKLNCIRLDLERRLSLGRAGEEIAKAIGVLQGPDIELDIKK